MEHVFPVLVVSLSIGNKAEAIDLRIEPSRLLYGIDRTAFVGVLSDTPELLLEDDDEDEGDAPAAAVPTTEPETGAHAEPVAVVVVGSYSGVLAYLRDSLRAFVVSEDIIAAPNDELLNSLLATAESNSGVDWQSRENLQARMKIGFRRVLSKEGIDPTKVVDASERLLTWLKVSAPAGINDTNS
jgi:hypothetical protein